MPSCDRCEYELGCFLPLRILHHYTGYPCKQGRKRKVLRQANIGEFKEVKA